MNEIPHSGRVIELDAPASQDLTLQGSGPDANPVEMEWAPKNREAFDIEVRARIVSASSGLGSIPIVRWDTETGHGQAVWSEPQSAFPIVSGTPMLRYSLPARGMVWRVTTRRFRIGFVNQGTIVGGAVEKSVVQVTTNPTYGANRPDVYPYSHNAMPGTVQQPFPMTAREWRLRDSVGRPVALGAVSIVFTGVLGALFGPVDAALLFDWSPIPHEAASFTPGSLIYADYR